MTDLRQRWDSTEREQHEFVHGLTPVDLVRVIECWKGTSPTRLVGGTDFPSLAGLRASGDALEKD
jgi:hypothetical protein